MSYGSFLMTFGQRLFNIGTKTLYSVYGTLDPEMKDTQVIKPTKVALDKITTAKVRAMTGEYGIASTRIKHFTRTLKDIYDEQRPIKPNRQTIL